MNIEIDIDLTKANKLAYQRPQPTRMPLLTHFEDYQVFGNSIARFEFLMDLFFQSTYILFPRYIDPEGHRFTFHEAAKFQFMHDENINPLGYLEVSWHFELRESNQLQMSRLGK